MDAVCGQRRQRAANIVVVDELLNKSGDLPEFCERLTEDLVTLKEKSFSMQ